MKYCILLIILFFCGAAEQGSRVVNINNLPALVEILDSDRLYVNNSTNTTAGEVKAYAASESAPVTDTDKILRANFSTGLASYVTALDLKNYRNGLATPISNSNYFALIRDGSCYKVTALALKEYLLNAEIDYLPVIILAGQSNMEGPNDASAVPAPYNGVLSDARVYYKNTTSGTTNGVIASLQYGVNNNWRTSELDTHGPELSIGYQLPVDLSHQIGIVKYSLGGSRLVDDGVTVSNVGLWDVDGDASRAGSYGLHFPILVNNFVKPALQKYIDAGYTPKIAAFVWCQGESDATIEYCASNYETKLTQLLNEFKNQIRSVEPNVDTMRVVISRIHNNFTPGTRPYLTEVRTALENVGNNYLNGHWINTDAYPVLGDNTHWTKAGQITHGLDITNILKLHL